jgi:hypothetical protein
MPPQSRDGIFEGNLTMKKALTGFALFAVTALAACAADEYASNGYSRTGTGSVGIVKRNQSNGGTRYNADPSDVLAGGFGG